MLWLLIFLVGFSAPNVSSGDPEGLQLEAISIEHLNTPKEFKLVNIVADYFQTTFVSANFKRTKKAGAAEGQSYYDPTQEFSTGLDPSETGKRFMQFVICPVRLHSRLSNGCIVEIVQSRAIHFRSVRDPSEFNLSDMVYDKEDELIQSGQFTLCLIDATATAVNLNGSASGTVTTIGDMIKNPRYCFQVTMDSQILEAIRERKQQETEEYNTLMKKTDSEYKNMQIELETLVNAITAGTAELNLLKEDLQQKKSVHDSTSKEITDIYKEAKKSNDPIRTSTLSMEGKQKTTLLVNLYVPQLNEATAKVNDAITRQNANIKDKKILKKQMNDILALRAKESEAQIIREAEINKAEAEAGVQFESLELESDDEQLLGILGDDDDDEPSHDGKRKKREISEKLHSLASQEIPEQTFLSRMAALNLIPESSVSMDEFKAEIKSITKMDPEQLIRNSSLEGLNNKMKPFKKKFKQIAVKKMETIAKSVRESAAKKYGELSEDKLKKLFPVLQQVESQVKQIEQNIVEDIKKEEEEEKARPVIPQRNPSPSVSAKPQDAVPERTPKPTSHASPIPSSNDDKKTRTQDEVAQRTPIPPSPSSSNDNAKAHELILQRTPSSSSSANVKVQATVPQSPPHYPSFNGNLQAHEPISQSPPHYPSSSDDESDPSSSPRASPSPPSSSKNLQIQTAVPQSPPVYPRSNEFKNDPPTSSNGSPSSSDSEHYHDAGSQISTHYASFSAEDESPFVDPSLIGETFPVRSIEEKEISPSIEKLAIITPKENLSSHGSSSTDKVAAKTIEKVNADADGSFIEKLAASVYNHLPSAPHSKPADGNVQAVQDSGQPSHHTSSVSETKTKVNPPVLPAKVHNQVRQSKQSSHHTSSSISESKAVVNPTVLSVKESKPGSTQEVKHSPVKLENSHKAKASGHVADEFLVTSKLVAEVRVPIVGQVSPKHQPKMETKPVHKHEIKLNVKEDKAHMGKVEGKARGKTEETHLKPVAEKPIKLVKTKLAELSGKVNEKAVNELEVKAIEKKVDTVKEVKAGKLPASVETIAQGTVANVQGILKEKAAEIHQVKPVEKVQKKLKTYMAETHKVSPIEKAKEIQVVKPVGKDGEIVQENISPGLILKEDRGKTKESEGEGEAQQAQHTHQSEPKVELVPGVISSVFNATRGIGTKLAIDSLEYLRANGPKVRENGKKAAQAATEFVDKHGATVTEITNKLARDSLEQLKKNGPEVQQLATSFGLPSAIQFGTVETAQVKEKESNVQNKGGQREQDKAVGIQKKWAAVVSEDKQPPKAKIIPKMVKLAETSGDGEANHPNVPRPAQGFTYKEVVGKQKQKGAHETQDKQGDNRGNERKSK